jgi:hypothetical protein
MNSMSAIKILSPRDMGSAVAIIPSACDVFPMRRMFAGSA